ncbi:hypothetical protein [Paraburkholderia sp. EG304]
MQFCPDNGKSFGAAFAPAVPLAGVAALPVADSVVAVAAPLLQA